MTVRSPYSCFWAHPRSRGADPVAVALVNAALGSSPLARGGPQRARSVGSVQGLIPARAGRTLDRSRALAFRWAHPRSRGADPFEQGRDLSMVGSSPLARGGPARGSPAGRRSGAHPRSRGADSRRAGRRRPIRGSSPLARGGLWGVRTVVSRRGSSPLARGGHALGRRPCRPKCSGSSPLARGGHRLGVRP